MLAPPKDPKDRAATDSSWTITFDALHRVSTHSPVAAFHYQVAREQFARAVDWLTERFSQISSAGRAGANTWIADFNVITSAAREHIYHSDAAEWHAEILGEILSKQVSVNQPARHESATAERADDPTDMQLTALTRQTILDLAAARWIWADPLGDPMLTLNPILENGFRTLAPLCPPGQRRLIAEAEFYQRHGRP